MHRVFLVGRQSGLGAHGAHAAHGTAKHVMHASRRRERPRPGGRLTIDGMGTDTGDTEARRTRP